MNKPLAAALAVIIILQAAILVAILFSVRVIFKAPTPAPTATPTPTSTPTPTPKPTSTPTPTPTPINYNQMPGTLTITAADYVNYGYGQLWVWCNWTGPSFTPPRIRLSIEEHDWWWRTGRYVINYTGNKDPLIWDMFPLGNYSATAQITLEFYDETSSVPFRVANYPVSLIREVDWHTLT